MKNSEAIIKYLSKEASIEECRQVEEWINSNKENAAFFGQLKAIWEKSGKEEIIINGVDVEKDFQELKFMIEDIPVQEFSQRKSIGFYLFRVAAILALSFSAWYFLSGDFSKNELITVASTQIDLFNDTLSDGSIVCLNTNSEIKHLAVFDDNKREVLFSGEGFFEIKKNKHSPFIVLCGDVKVEVIGTSFNINNYPNSSEIAIIVQNGTVKTSIIGNDNSSISIQAGETGIYNKKEKSLYKKNTSNLNYLSWKTGIFAFRETPMSEVVEILGQKYKIAIVIKNNKLGNCPLTADFDNQPLDAILEILEITYGIKAEKKQEKIILYGEGFGC